MLNRKVASLTPGEYIRQYMRSNNIQISEVAKKAEISEHDVKNVLYNKTQKKDKIKKIAEALELPEESFEERNISLNFEFLRYKIAVNVVANVLVSHNISSDKEGFDALVIEIYHYLSENLNYSEKEASIFCTGMISQSVKSGVLQRSTK